MYPSIIQESVTHLMSASVNVHKICKFLMEMSSAVSIFYHRHHVLSVINICHITVIDVILIFLFSTLCNCNIIFCSVQTNTGKIRVLKSNILFV